MIGSHDMNNVVQLLGPDGTPAGFMAKQAAHQSPGYLHRGFSVFLFDENARVLLQRRAANKYHFAGRWSNACCSHPSGDATLEATATSRLMYELGVETALELVGSFTYSAADDKSGRVEREDDSVLVGYVRSDVSLTPNPNEVSATRFVAIGDLQEELRASSDKATPWLAEALGCVVRSGHPHI